MAVCPGCAFLSFQTQACKIGNLCPPQSAFLIRLKPGIHATSLFVSASHATSREVPQHSILPVMQSAFVEHQRAIQSGLRPRRAFTGRHAQAAMDLGAAVGELLIVAFEQKWQTQNLMSLRSAEPICLRHAWQLAISHGSGLVVAVDGMIFSWPMLDCSCSSLGMQGACNI